jgi:hypothetical protein
MRRKVIIMLVIIVALVLVWLVLDRREAVAPQTESMLLDDGTPLENPDADMIDDTSFEQGGDFEGITP